jgi:ribosome-associated protein
VLRWRAIATSAAISVPAMERMRARFPARFTIGGDVVIQSQQYRDQDRNKEECLAKLSEMIRAALVEPRPRKATKPTKGSQRRRLSEKRRQSERKRNRRASGDD